MAFLDKHEILERNATLLMVGALAVVTIGGIVEFRARWRHGAGRS